MADADTTREEQEQAEEESEEEDKEEEGQAAYSCKDRGAGDMQEDLSDKQRGAV